VLEHVKAVTPTDEYKFDNDFGNEWLKTGFAGSGPFKLREWRANEVVVLERNDGYWGDKTPLARVIYRHVKESATQRLMLEKGDVDVARNLEPGDLDAVAQNADIATTAAAKGTVYYISLNQKNANLAKPEVREAFKYLVDYDALQSTLLKGIGEIHQTFLPKGVRRQADADQVSRPQPRHLYRTVGPGLFRPELQRRNLHLQPEQRRRFVEQDTRLAQRMGRA